MARDPLVHGPRLSELWKDIPERCIRNCSRVLAVCRRAWGELTTVTSRIERSGLLLSGLDLVGVTATVSSLPLCESAGTRNTAEGRSIELRCK